jgi:hypothetical protein
MDEILPVTGEKALYLPFCKEKSQGFGGFKEKQKSACILFNDIFVKYSGDAMKKKVKVCSVAYYSSYSYLIHLFLQ